MKQGVLATNDGIHTGLVEPIYYGLEITSLCV
ncbi:hypothetical protein SHVI106290_17700 [Shewanella violacea]